jgi:hypothetical protein
MTATIKTVHTVFKTHLDLGFTDLAQAVVRQYFDEYLPQAMDTAETLRRAGGPDRFVWTAGAWLIDHYLETAGPAARKRMEAAIEAGDITWHTLPFTVHAELMDPSLFRYGLGFAQRLDDARHCSPAGGGRRPVSAHRRQRGIDHAGRSAPLYLAR